MLFSDVCRLKPGEYIDKYLSDTVIDLLYQNKNKNIWQLQRKHFKKEFRCIILMFLLQAIPTILCPT